MDALATVTAALSAQYVFEREIGRGGMAVVFLARDLKHGRRVAVKVLNPELAAVLGPERFLSEIRITANLQHPNLLPLFDSGEVDGMLYYVMPFVDGESLRDKLTREQQLPIDEALRIATAVASALDYAHRHGVVHRDLKPENILLHDGSPMVMDFGIALAVSNAGAGRLTQTGLSLGTPYYMSPEQATGERNIDRRADVYALGAVLYEMLTGQPPFTGANAQTVIAKVLTERPQSVRSMRGTVPAQVDATVSRALSKLPADRWSSAHDFAAALAGEHALLTGTFAPNDDSAPTVGWKARLRLAAPFAAAALVLGALGSAAVLRPWKRAADPSYAFTVTLPDSAAVSTGGGGGSGYLAISRDGRMIAYMAGPASGGDVSRGVWIRSVDELSPRPVRGLERASSPRFSPDGSMIAYLGAGLFVMPVAGGTALKLDDSASSPDWIDRGSLVYSRGFGFWIGPKNTTGLWVTTVKNPAPRLAVPADTTRQIYGVGHPNVLPGGSHALVTIWKGPPNNVQREVAVASLRDGTITELGIVGSNPRYCLGQMLFVRDDGGLYSAPFSLAERRISGAITLIASQVVLNLTGAAAYDVSDNGTLTYVGGSDMRRRLVLVDRTGHATTIAPDIRRFYTPRVSPNGRAIAVEVGNAQGFDVWTYDFASRTLGAVTLDHHGIRPIAWINGESDVAYIHADDAAGPWEVMTQSADGRMPAKSLVAQTLAPTDATIGGSMIAWRSGGEIRMAPLDHIAEAQSLVSASVSASLPRLSRDGRYLAYASAASGVVEIYAQPTATGGQRVQVSSGGGAEPLWSPAGDELFFRTGTHLVAAKLALDPLRVVRRDTLFRDTYVRGASSVNYDAMPDGQHFVMVQSENPDVYPTIMVNRIRPR